MNTHNRQSIRLKEYDYSSEGAYYITICVNDRKCWNEIPEHFPHTALDNYILMPNHVHGIINIFVGAKNFLPLQHGTSKTIGSVVRGFKIGVTKWVRQNTDTKNVWQRNYYEHVIRNAVELHKIREYIINNPAKWEDDEYYSS